MTTRPRITTSSSSRHTRPNSAVYIGPIPSLNSSSYTPSLSATPPELPEPPSPVSEKSSSSVGSGLPSPPATNSTGSGSTRGQGGLGSGGDDDDTARFGTVSRGSGGGSTGSGGRDSRGSREDRGEREGGDGDVLKRVKSLQERNRLALNKLSTYTRNTPSPKPPPSSSSTTSSSSHSSSSSRPLARTRHSYTPSLSSIKRDLSGSETEREPSLEPDGDMYDDSPDASPSPAFLLLNHTSLASGSGTTFKTPGRPTTPSGGSRTSSGHSQTLSPRMARTRLISAPASPAKALSSISRSTSGSGSNSNPTQSPRKRASLIVDRDRDREDIASRALAAVASSRRGLTPINTNMQQSSNRRSRQPLPKEFWDASSAGGSGSASTSSYGEEVRLDSAHPSNSSNSSSDRSFLRLSRTPSPSPSRSRSPSRTSHSRPPSSAQLQPQRYGTLSFTPAHPRRLHRRPSQSEDLGNRTPLHPAPGRKQTLRQGGSADSVLTVNGGSARLVGEGLRAAGMTLRSSPERERFRGRESPVFERERSSREGREREREREERLERIRTQSRSRAGGGGGRAMTSLDYYDDTRDREDGGGGRASPGLRQYKSTTHFPDRDEASGQGLRAYKSTYFPEREDSGRAPSRVGGGREREQDGMISPFGTTTRRYTPLSFSGVGGGGAGGGHIKSASQPATSHSTGEREREREHTKLMQTAYEMFDQSLSRLSGSGVGGNGAGEVRRAGKNVVALVERLNGMMRTGTGRMLEGQVECEVREATGASGSGSEAEIYRRLGGEYREALRVSDELVRGLTEMMLGLPRVLREFERDGRDGIVRSPESVGSASRDREGAGARSRPGTSMEKDTGSNSNSALRRQDTGTTRRLQIGGMSTFDSQETVQASAYEPSPTPASRVRVNGRDTLRETTYTPARDRDRERETTYTPARDRDTPANTNTTLSRRRTATTTTLRAALPTTAITDEPGSATTFSRSSSSGVSALREMRERSISNSSEKERWEEFGYHNGLAGSGVSQSTNGVVGRGGAGGGVMKRTISGSETEREPIRERDRERDRGRVRMSLDGSGAGAGAGTVGGSGKRERRRTVVDMWPRAGDS
ncbi:hypothetical protein VNI00_019344 [Paramarasmius palmivorus]|uniref:Uncharacterized protein n=1 Tax=Paramarasmius palmivorus TaxID=297713 RepID=A0AAW0AQU9_9AGAR